MGGNVPASAVESAVKASMTSAAPVSAVPSGGTERTLTEDITSKESKATPTLDNPADMDALLRMKGKTPARIGVGPVPEGDDRDDVPAFHADAAAQTEDHAAFPSPWFVITYSVLSILFILPFLGAFFNLSDEEIAARRHGTSVCGHAAAAKQKTDVQRFCPASVNSA